MKLGLEIDEVDGNLIGRDPRDMTMEELKACGHEPMPVLEAIRASCIDCSHLPGEVRKCVAIDCPSWPFRMGFNPWRSKREMTDEERLATGERLKKARLKRNEQ